MGKLWLCLNICITACCTAWETVRWELWFTLLWKSLQWHVYILHSTMIKFWLFKSSFEECFPVSCACTVYYSQQQHIQWIFNVKNAMKFTTEPMNDIPRKWQQLKPPSVKLAFLGHWAIPGDYHFHFQINVLLFRLYSAGLTLLIFLGGIHTK